MEVPWPRRLRIKMSSYIATEERNCPRPVENNEYKKEYNIMNGIEDELIRKLMVSKLERWLEKNGQRWRIPLN